MNFKRSHSIVSLIKETFMSDVYSDVRIVSRSASFCCHKAVLGAVSPYLSHLLLQTSPSDHQVSLVLSDSSDEDVQQFLAFAYGLSPAIPESLKFLIYSQPLFEQQKENSLVKCEIEEDITDYLDPRENVENDIDNSKDLSYESGSNDFDNQNYTKKEEEDAYESDYDSDSQGERRNLNIDSKIFVTGEGGRKRRKYCCPFCQHYVYQLSRHVFSAHQQNWEEFDSVRDKTKQVREREYPKKCELCPRYLSCKYHYERHLKSHQHKSVKAETKASEEPSSFVCDLCGMSYSQKSSLIKHKSKHKNDYQCDEDGCIESFHDHLAYRNHMLFKHQRVIPRKRNDPKQTHINNTSKSKQTGPETEEKNIEKKYLCSECGRGFRQPGELKKHFVIHTNEQLPEFICTTCGKKFKTKYKLAYHMKLHEAPTLPCPFCEKLFETDHKRKKHIKSIHVQDSEKLYQCNICNKGFPFFPSYESHMNSHKNLRPYSCHLCDNAYQNHFNLQQHVKKSHGIFISRSDHGSLS